MDIGVGNGTDAPGDFCIGRGSLSCFSLIFGCNGRQRLDAEIEDLEWFILIHLKLTHFAL